MQTFLCAFLCTVGAVFLCGLFAVPVLKKVKAGQPILKYVKEHESKSGTPTMGGLFFILPCAAVFFAFGGWREKLATFSAAIGLFYMFVGFLDDFIKIKLKHNEGLKPYQKILFQTAIAVLGGAFAYVNGLTAVYIPFVKKTAELGAFTIVLIAVVFIAITNSVNLTDGLDGLCGGVSLWYAVFIAVIIGLETGFDFSYIKSEESGGMLLLLFTLAGGILGFLIFNSPKARVFMGDTGSLAIGGFLGAISVFSGNTLFVPIIGGAFVLSSLSVMIQVAHFKRTGKRVFLMAPFHHHLQMKGFTETQISFYYSLFTIITGTVSVIFYL
ncbi:MAG: phospho-N-acetylmuramoyl-pentapeptide-transferase [Clostridia bacterium]|nr:phospho-N-acetylmuramoyl-pentapeptide-transferase [Clostridia bacterium]